MYQEEQQDERQLPLTSVCLHNDNVIHRESETSDSPAMQYNTSHHRKTGFPWSMYLLHQ